MCPNMLASATLGSSQDRYIFARGAKGAMWYRRADADGWATEWEDLGGWFDSAPMVWPPTEQDEALHVFGLGPKGVIIHGTFSVGGEYEFGEGSWFDDGGELTPTPYRVEN
ncbi:hypothetical protein F5X68DRAFT_198560 [Plectosphaerella plurivora]|uniref:Uncharacterized protein n=1 Tax=Plectosphaerella plurivora TaxID=936078 RepID=A0A9P8VKD4_9PEZI|nr:hypothetical protein F5X68DRAFT_198560 [Plectosphaerella plurivora]